MDIKIIVDSSSDILPEEAKRLGLIHLPLTVRFGTSEYIDSVTLSHREFYEKLIESDILPSTSQLSQITYRDVYKKIIADGDMAIVITLSSKLSGTYQNAVLAAEGFEERIYVIDSENVCIGERILILRALELIRDGLPIERIVDCLNQEKKQICILALLNTLEYLKKGGRISSTTALAGSLLSIKPVVTVENGEVKLIGKARGSKNGNNLLRELILKCGGICFEKPYYLAYSGLSDSLLQKYIADSAELWQAHTHELPVSTVGSIIGTYVGAGAIAVAFFAKDTPS